MPKITRWFIKSGMIYFFMGLLLAIVAEFPTIKTGSLLLPVYWHMIVIGWITQVIMGVSIWMFPRKKRDRRKEVSLSAKLAFWFLNTGLILRFLSEPFIPFFEDDLLIVATVLISSVLQVAAVLFFVMEIWPRVQPKKKRKKRKKEEKLMSAQSIWMIRLSLLSLLISVLIGGLLLVHKVLPVHPMLWAFLPVHYEIAILGWLVQFVMGTAYWMFPRHLTGPGRGSEGLAWVLVVMFNLGLLILLIASATAYDQILPLTGRGCMILAVILFGALMWNRVVSYRERV